VYKVPSLNCSHCLVNTNRFGVYIAHFVVVNGTRFSVLWGGSSVSVVVNLLVGEPILLPSHREQIGSSDAAIRS
jgi:hypothetical protein